MHVQTSTLLYSEAKGFYCYCEGKSVARRSSSSRLRSRIKATNCGPPWSNAVMALIAAFFAAKNCWAAGGAAVDGGSHSIAGRSNAEDGD